MFDLKKALAEIDEIVARNSEADVVTKELKDHFERSIKAAVETRRAQHKPMEPSDFASGVAFYAMPLRGR